MRINKDKDRGKGRMMNSSWYVIIKARENDDVGDSSGHYSLLTYDDDCSNHDERLCREDDDMIIVEITMTSS